ncbi:MAG: S-methyl-5-thioribose-1-phosphate isomerase [Methanomicrobiales archaeon]
MESRETLWWEDGAVCLIDQTRLPGDLAIVRCESVDRLAAAIRRLEVRGAPALGVAGAYGIALAAAIAPCEQVMSRVEDAAGMLRSTRPTAVNLGWGIDRVLDAIRRSPNPDAARTRALEEAHAIAAGDRETCRRIGAHGASLMPEDGVVLTHCNAGALACVAWGTALGVIRSAVEEGRSVRVVACETRPLHQGSRLTAWELSRDGIPVTVITDSTAAYLMQRGEIDCVVVGADRITADAVFNKIGTYMHAVCACHHRIPFYVAAPRSTFDPDRTADEVEIEQRDRDEIARCGDRMLAPPDVPVKNPAFDATPLSLVTAIITEDGVIRPPYTPASLAMKGISGPTPHV